MTASLDPHATAAPSPWIERYAHLVPAGARVLDVAAGRGRHARLFASRRAHVIAVDRDAGALAELADAAIETQALDLETGAWPLGAQTFDAIVVVNYLHRPLFAHLFAALAPAGVLLYETFAAGNEAYGRPSRPDFLLRDGELLDVVRGHLTVVGYEHGLERSGDRAVVVQRIAAVGPAFRMPPLLSPSGDVAGFDGGIG